MPKFFEKVNTPESQRVQAKSPSGPSVDVNARQEAANESQSSIGNAVQSLLGVATQVDNTVTKINKENKAIMEKDNQLEADYAVRDYPSKTKIALEAVALSKGKSLRDLTDEEIQTELPKIRADFVSNKKELEGANYLPIVEDRLDVLQHKYSLHQNKVNTAYTKDKNYDKLFVTEFANFKNVPDADLDSWLKVFSENLENTVGDGRLIEDTKEDASGKLVTRFIEGLVKANDPKLKAKFDKAVKSGLFKNVDDLKSLSQVVEQATYAELSKQQQLNLEKASDGVYGGIDSGAYNKASDITAYYKELDERRKQSGDELYAPDPKKYLKQKAAAYKAVEEEGTFQDIYDEVDKGDFTIVDRALDTVKEKENYWTKHYSKKTGITDMSALGILTATVSGEVDETSKSYAESGARYPEAVILAYDTPPIAGGGKTLPEMQQLQVNALKQMVGLTQDTPRSITSQLKVSSVTRIMHTGSVLDRVADGTLNAKEAQDAISAYSNDLKKNTNSRGIFTSEKAEAAYTKERQEEVSEYANEVEWTTDAAQSSDYLSSELENNFKLFIDAGLKDDEAMKKAKAATEGSNQRFENDDGTEGILPNAFRHLNVDDVKTTILRHPKVLEIIKTQTFFDKAYRAAGAIAIHPTLNHHQDNLMEIYYDGKPVLGTQMNLDQLNSNINSVKKFNREKIVTDFVQKREEQLDNN